jgi:hypothetical protein
MRSASGVPVEGAYVAYAAIDRALDLEHTPHISAWHKISRRLWVTTCERCGLEVWISGPAGGWRYGGSATREPCPEPAPEAA